MSYAKIQAALETQVQEIVDVPVVTYDNQKYDPVTGIPYIRCRYIPTDRTNKVLGIDVDNKPFWQEYHGILQLYLHMPEGKGSGPTNDLVERIIDKFEATTDLEFDGVYVTVKKVERARGINETPWFKTPVNIYWYSHSK